MVGVSMDECRIEGSVETPLCYSIYNGVTTIHAVLSTFTITPWMVAICCLVTADCLNVTDQQTSESQPEQVAILKQLRKVNEDGSYTYGYEAGDGSYKVETRDVLGNVRGTFGFVDANGEIKRVTYSSSNGTGFKATTVSPMQEHISVVQNIPRTNRSSSTKQAAPSMTYTTSTESSSMSSPSAGTLNPKFTVVQSIPRRSRIKATTASTITNATTESPAKAIFGHYIKASKYRPRLIINEQQKPITTSNAQELIENQYSQITRPTVEVKTPIPRKIMTPKRIVDHTLRPITEEFEEKSQSLKSSHTGNTLRRQLQEERSIKVEESPENSSDENSDVYMGSLSTTRPLFTTSAVPKIIQQIRTDQSKMIYQQSASLNEDNMSADVYDNDKYEAKKVHEIDNKFAMKERLTPTQLNFRAVSVPSRIPQREYIIKQSSDEPIHIRHQPEQIMRESSSTILMPTPENDNDEGTIYSTSSIDTILSQQQAAALRQPIYPEVIDLNNADSSKNTRINPEELPSSSPSSSIYSAHSTQSTLQTPHHSLHRNKYIRSRYLPRLIPYQQQEYVKQLQSNNLKSVLAINQQDYSEHPYRDIILPPEAPNPIAPPLSRRDFQILLRHLLASQYSTRALNHPRTYLDDSSYDQDPHSTYQSSYNVRPSQHALIYNEPNLLPITYSDGVNRVINGDLSKITITNSNSAPYQNMHYQMPNYYDPIYVKRIYRKNVYDQDMNNGAEANGDEILPPPIREALLLRMLQLAIGYKRSIPMGVPPLVSNSASSITTAMPVTRSIYRKLGPVRSVQIITDDKSEEKDSIIVRKKI
ncbi:hypothetical protein PV327_008798 [Microctonus hyperodae]|uniref:Uncharacterized protein n=1 Tax=Microctonus hyperodae TaxID=165561 RepID=A0AA39KV30_MICHY|nr:hypothetical protein PV327_008798 [Microctonus hyperodae]